MKKIVYIVEDCGFIEVFESRSRALRRRHYLERFNRSGEYVVKARITLRKALMSL